MEDDVFTNLMLVDFIDGSESALDHIYKSFAPKVYKVAYFLLQDNGWSDDVVQEVFIKLWENRMKLQREQNLWSYLYVLTKRASLNKLRSIKRSNTCFQQLWSNISDVNNEVEDHILAKELADQIDRFVAQLPPQQQKIFTLSRIGGFSHQEIAEQLGISPNTVRNHIVQVLKSFRQYTSSNDLILYMILPTVWEAYSIYSSALPLSPAVHF
ncbi:RNA polymerase sigma factor [Sphingobacterium sp. SYP-B4668]|uniref:RNA polymerase sigma factor n=1 Tax=Sphingobacterium sp. SYP-B4668 TaxID=2996035 RepID=UPI0022DD8B53|nr:RNA polymerase sigma-70 factor [Sphingobacterium sp. SYP-B4668]